MVTITSFWSLRVMARGAAPASSPVQSVSSNARATDCLHIGRSLPRGVAWGASGGLDRGRAPKFRAGWSDRLLDVYGEPNLGRIGRHRYRLALGAPGSERLQTADELLVARRRNQELVDRARSVLPAARFAAANPGDQIRHRPVDGGPVAHHQTTHDGRRAGLRHAGSRRTNDARR